ncbi:MAG: hypothetical protein JWQ29_2454 [Phenylobacterium sp.]|nr:hypothetical protein [Phenylobacterium sp.]
MTGLKIDLSARDALRAVIAVGFLAMLGANLPGHLSYDSVSQLSEGHFHVRSTWGPVLYAGLLGFFDGVVPGAALYVVASGLLFFGALASLADLRTRTGWLAVVVAALVVLTPQVMIYQAIVWKDVAFANTAVAGLICLAHAARHWNERGRRWLWLAGALVLLAVAVQVRQNGLIAAILAAVSLGWIGAGGRWLRGAAWGLGGFVAVLLVAKALTVLAMPANAPREDATATGISILQKYDVIGAAALDPAYRLPIMAAANPAATAVVLSRAKADYSGRRVDFIDRDPMISQAMESIPNEAAAAQWVDLVTRHTGLYLRLRWEDFRWVAIPPVIDFCLPVYVGVDAPAPLLDGLKMPHRYSQTDVELTNYATWFYDTPVFSHLAYALISLVLAGLLLLRRQPADIAMAALQLAGVGFTASFFLISIACDYRYLYFTDLAAMAGLVYAALDPPLPGRRKAP